LLVVGVVVVMAGLVPGAMPRPVLLPPPAEFTTHSAPVFAWKASS
jgi:hypothetical protein